MVAGSGRVQFSSPFSVPPSCKLSLHISNFERDICVTVQLEQTAIRWSWLLFREMLLVNACNPVQRTQESLQLPPPLCKRIFPVCRANVLFICHSTDAAVYYRQPVVCLCV